MAEPFFLIQHWKKQQKIFTANLLLLKSKSDMDPIHNWRVSVKKLRSYLKLFFLIQDRKYDKEWLANSEKLFRIIGKQRDISMSQSLLAELAKKDNASRISFNAYFDYAFLEAQKRTNQALHDFNDEELQKVYEHISIGLSKKSIEKIKTQAEDIIRKQIGKISELLKNTSQKNAHKLRKLMKDLLYWTSICPSPTPINAGGLKILGKITDKFGNWQDMNVFITKIKHFRSDQLAKKTDEYFIYKLLEKQLKKKNQEHLQKAEKTAKDFFYKIHS